MNYQVKGRYNVSFSSYIIGFVTNRYQLLCVFSFF